MITLVKEVISIYFVLNEKDRYGSIYKALQTWIIFCTFRFSPLHLFRRHHDHAAPLLIKDRSKILVDGVARQSRAHQMSATAFIIVTK